MKILRFDALPIQGLLTEVMIVFRRVIVNAKDVEVECSIKSHPINHRAGSVIERMKPPPTFSDDNIPLKV